MPRSVTTFIVVCFVLLVPFTGTAEESGTDERRILPAPAKCLHVDRYQDLIEEDPDPRNLTGPRADTPAPPAGDRGYDVQSYDLDLRLHPDTSTLDGVVVIGLRTLDASLDRIRLDLVDELTVDAVTAGLAELTFTHAGDSLVIDPQFPLNPGEALDLTITWHGRPPRHGNYYAGLLFRNHEGGTPGDPSDDRPAICSISEPWSAHSWWPCKDHPSDKAQVTIGLTVPDDLIAVANGEFLGQSDPEPGWRRFDYRENAPLATYLVAIYASDYAAWTEDCWVTVADPPGQPVSLEFYAFPHNEQNVRTDLAVTCDMLEFWSDLVGAYPFAGEKYAQLEVKWGGAMENQTVTALGSFLLQGDGRFEPIVIHELSHHWFGNSLTPATWSDIWLNEGFARYSEALWAEHTQGREAYIDFMHEIGYRSHEDLFRTREPLLEPSPVLPNILVYDKGAWVLHMLRMLVGDAAFFQFLADYAQDPALVMNSVSTPQMIAVAERSAGRTLQDFFDPWLTTSSIPVLRYTTTRPGQDQASGEVGLEFRQVQDPLFEVAVPVRIYQRGATSEHMAHVRGRHSSFSWAVTGPVDSVVVDPDTLVLIDARPEPSQSLQILGPNPNPVIGERAYFRIYLTHDSQVIVKIIDMTGKVVESWNLGVLPATGAEGDPVAVAHTWRWYPGEGGVGRPAAGVYTLQFSTDSATVSRKATLLH